MTCRIKRNFVFTVHRSLFTVHINVTHELAACGTKHQRNLLKRKSSRSRMKNAALNFSRYIISM